MQTGKPSIAYKWMIGLTIVVTLSILLNFFYAIYQGIAMSLLGKVFLPLIVLFTVLILEIIYYKRNRKWITPRSWAMVHIAGLYLALVVMPVTRILFIVFLPYYLNPDALQGFMSNLSSINFYVYWGGIIIGHLFFIGVMIKTRSAKMAPQNAGNSPDLLDNILE